MATPSPPKAAGSAELSATAARPASAEREAAPDCSGAARRRLFRLGAGQIAELAATRHPRDGEGELKTGRLGSSSLTATCRSGPARHGFFFRLRRSPTSPAKMSGRGRAGRIERGSPCALTLSRSVYPLMAAGGSRRAPSVPMTGRLALSPIWLFSVFDHNARMPQTLADPAGGRAEALDLSSRNEGFDLFSPPLKRLLAHQKRIAPSSSSSAFRACGCGPDRPRQLIAIEAAMVVASNENQKENDNG